jgi:hypothetical protein
MAVWDNIRTKDILNQDNPELCERIARSIGTHQVRELTVRRKEGPLLTSLPPVTPHLGSWRRIGCTPTRSRRSPGADRGTRCPTRGWRRWRTR